MREMKDSGLCWVHEIPHNWNVKRLGNFYHLRNTKVSDKEYPPLSVTMKGILPQLETAAKTNDHNNRKLVKKGDFAINSRSDRRGSCGISSYDGSVSLINTVLVPREKMNPIYFNWLFHSSQFSDEFYKWGHGIVDDLWTTTWQDMKKIAIPVPPLIEQQAIADFLDAQCADIDSLTEDIQKQIETLKEYKKSVITQVVTKGLNLNVEMKDSGVKWIGIIPNTWYCGATKHFLEIPITDGPHTTPKLYDTGIPFVSAEAVTAGNGRIDFSHIRGYISESFYKECCKKYTPQLDDIYMIKSGATTGNVAIVDTDVIFNIWSPLAAFRVNRKKIIARFLYYFLQSNCYQMQVQLGWNYGTQQNIGMKTLENLKICIPPREEQRIIVNFLDSKCTDIDVAIEGKQKQLDVLKEYKKSLIYEYVTGKKEVPCCE